MNADTENSEVCNSCIRGSLVKLYAHGKIGLLFDGPEKYRGVAEECFEHALDIHIKVDDLGFVRAMRDRGIPEAAINEFLKTCLLVDEVRLASLNPFH